MKKLNAKKIYLGVAGVAVVAVLFFVFKGGQKQQEVKIKRGDLVEAAYAVGTVKADRTFNLKVGVASRVLERFVHVGDSVKAGQPLMHIEGVPLSRAPFDGIVTALNYEKGELVFAQTTALTVVDLHSLYMELSMDERSIGAIRPGQEARISFEGQRQLVKIGKVRSVYSSDGSFLVLVDSDFNGLQLLPSMTADVAVQVGVHQNQLLIPLGAVATAGHVTVLRENKSKDILITTGATDGKFAVIEKGDLAEGDGVRLQVCAHTDDGGGPH